MTTQKHSASEFVRFLDNQIDYLFKMGSISGWSIWTLIGALATLIWVTGGVIARGSIDWYLTALAFLYLSYLLGIFPVKESSSRNVAGPLRYAVFRDLINGKQRAIVFEGVKSLLFVTLCVLTFSGGYRAFSLIVLAFWLGRAVLMLLGLVISFMNFPMVLSGQHKNTEKYEKVFRWIGFVVAVLLVFGFYGFSRFISSFSLFDLGSIKVSVLLVASIYLIEKIVDTDVTISSGVIKLLAEIRSKVVLKEMEYSEAFTEVRVALLGYDAGEIFKKEYDSLLCSLREIRSVNNSVLKLLVSVEKYFTTPTELLTEKQRQEVNANLDKIHDHLLNNSINFKALRKKHSALEMKIQVLEKTGCEPGAYSSQRADLDDVIDGINSDRARFAKRFVKIKDLSKRRLDILKMP